MSTMKAWTQSAPGECDYKLEEARPIPKAKEGQVIIKNKAVGSNPIDWKASNPAFGGGPETYAARSKVFGVDGAGVITEVGGGVSDFKVGDAVWYMTGLTGDGTYAEYSVAQVSNVFKLGDFAMEQAGTAGCVLFTTVIALYEKLRVQAGEFVVINGASGGVGCVAVQIAKNLGAKVIGVCSERNTEFVKGLGADFVVDYTKGDEFLVGEIKKITGGAGASKVFDCVCNDVPKLFAVLRNGGEICTLLSAPLSAQQAGAAFFNNISVHPLLVLTYSAVPWNIPRVREIVGKAMEMVSAKKLTIPISKRFKFSEVMEAQKENMKGRTAGKNVILFE